VSAYISSASRPRRSSVIALLIAAAVLYLASEVMIPLAMAILLSFLLAPAVRRLERWQLGRPAATIIVVLVAFSIVFAVAALAASQAVSLAASLPEYRENIVEKIRALRHPNKSTVGKAAEAIQDLQEEAAPERPPIPVKETAGTPLEAFADFVAPVAKPFAMTLAVIVFTVLMLLNRENMRERVIGLIGAGRINVTTRAMAEASYRVSRYLSMQLVVNAMFGIPFGIALYFIGVPNALLWGLLGMMLRFIPYAGVWVAAAMPAALAFAISDSWSPVLWTLGVFLAIELTLFNFVEPYLYGRTAGLSPIAVITAAIFWTWLWGPVGLLLAIPLTVCVAVMGRHIPEFGYLNVLLGVEPVLSPEERFYQRLVALDQEEAGDMIEKHVAAHGLATTFDRVIIPALSLAEIDRQKDALEPARERFVYEHARRIVEELDSPPQAANASQPSVCIVAAHDEADHVAAVVLAHLLAHANTCVIGAPALVAEIVETAEKRNCQAVCISAVPPHALNHAAYLARRLRRHKPDLKIVVGLWMPDADVGTAKERLAKLGVDEVVAHVSEAADLLRQLAGGAKQPERQIASMDRDE
jgi:predicted PurR-regulated permease PerM/methylmalonyl-CoA mutase cobalamin-binding subunit